MERGGPFAAQIDLGEGGAGGHDERGARGADAQVQDRAFDLGLIKIRNKGASKAAIELWQRLLKTNPNIPANKKTQIEKMIAEAKSGKPKDLN